MKKYNFEFKRRATILRNIEKEKYLQLFYRSFTHFTMLFYSLFKFLSLCLCSLLLQHKSDRDKIIPKKKEWKGTRLNEIISPANIQFPSEIAVYITPRSYLNRHLIIYPALLSVCWTRKVAWIVTTNRLPNFSADNLSKLHLFSNKQPWNADH